MATFVRIKLEFVLQVEGDSLPTVDILNFIEFGSQAGIDGVKLKAILPGAKIKITRTRQSSPG